jgi:hypothetical protein
MTSDKRVHERLEFWAQVEAQGGEGEIEIFEARNLSAGGIFLAVPPSACSWLLADARVELSIGGVNDVGGDINNTLIHVRARVVWRIGSGDTPGVGLVFVDLDDAQRERLNEVLRRAAEDKAHSTDSSAAPVK